MLDVFNNEVSLLTTTGAVYKPVCLQNRIFCCFDAGLVHMAARSRGNGTNFDWLRYSCDISTCDLSPDETPEKYGRPMKSAIRT